MPLDPEGTRQRIFDAAVAEFADHGSAGARIDRIAQKARANKESIYRYYGTKDELLARVLDRFIQERGDEQLPHGQDLAEYVADALGHFSEHPEFLRLVGWEALEHGHRPVAAAEQRSAHYARKLAAIQAAQRDGSVDPSLDPRHLLVVLKSLASYWITAPQIVELILGERADTDALERHRAFIAECVRRIVQTRPQPSE